MPMSHVYKHVLDKVGTTRILLPQKAMFMQIGIQNGIPVIWFLEPDIFNFVEYRTFEVVTTGENFDAKDKDYLSSFQLPSGFVGHVFESFNDENNIIIIKDNEKNKL